MRRLVVILLIAVFAACAHKTQSTETYVRSALDVLADVIDPAYALAVDGCVEREKAELAAERSGSQKSAVTDENLRAIRGRCDQVRAAFERIRDAHTDAAERVEAGAIDDAKEKIEEARKQWATLSQLAQ